MDTYASIIVGERRSHHALAQGAACYVSVWQDDGQLDTMLLATLHHVRAGVCIVALGERVHAVLTREGIAHRTLPQ